MIFVGGPMILSLSLGFFSVSGFSEYTFVGLDNYRRMAGDPLFWRSLRVTILYVVALVPLLYVVGLGLALLVQANSRFNTVVRTLLFMPQTVSLVVVGLVWQVLLIGKIGLFNQLGSAFGFGSISWLGDPRFALATVTAISVWFLMGFYMLIFLGGLQDIPREYYEAARIEGAGPVQSFFKITLPRALESEAVPLPPGEETVLDWRLPDTDGQPIQSIGVTVRSPGGAQDGEIVLDWLRWDGPPNTRLRRPEEPSDFWRRAWVNAVDTFSTSSPHAFRISQDRGEGMIIHGGRQWRDYRIETALTVHLAEHAGIGVRVQGLRRFYAVLLVRPNVLRLVRVRDGERMVLAEAPFEWSFERPYRLILETVGPKIEAAVDGVRLLARDDSEEAIADGGVALIVEGGAASSDEILVAPPHSSRRDSDEVYASELETRLERAHGKRWDRERRKIFRLGQGRHSQRQHRG